ncbi:MAG: DNA repair protein RecO [Lachnospiraceae bacterium]|nr:DNA repair protein RecO [Lachnospiraceae bacterium]
MNDVIRVTGMVISAMPMSENDRRVELLTAELGKISAFLRGGRKIGSPLLAAGRLFAFGEFELFQGRSAYTVRSADIKEFFAFLAADPEAFCYASYFAELAAYYSRENVEDLPLVRLLFYAVRSLHNTRLDRALVRYAYELKLMQTEGEALPEPPFASDSSAGRAWQYVLDTDADKCFQFLLEPQPFREFSQHVATLRNGLIDGRFRSLAVLEDYLSMQQ